jgi:hypothetical protein
LKNATVRRWGLAAARILVLVLGAAASTLAQGAFYREVPKDGRIYVFNDMQRLEVWEKSGDMGKVITQPGGGPNGETLVFDSPEALNLYNVHHEPVREAFLAAPAQPLSPQPAATQPATPQAAAQQPAAAPPSAPSSGPVVYKGLDGLSVGALWYISYQYFPDDGNQFTIKRGYIDIKKKVLSWGKNSFEARVTPDVTQDSTGDLKLRLKYIYGKWNVGANWEPYVEFGLAHMPWLDFEEHVNLYRMQDTMFLERNGLFNSADEGVTFGGFFGPKIKIPDAYPGKYGSFAVGVYNGAGYHGIEKNKNKAIEGRFSLRPFPNQLPGLQLSYFGISGKGNADTSPTYNVNLGFLSYQFDLGTLTAQYFEGKGNGGGSAVNPDGFSRAAKGYSFFGEFRFPPSKRARAIARYDWFDPNKNLSGNELKTWVFGLAWDMGHSNIILADYQKVKTPGKSDVDRYQLTLQVNY